MLSVILAAVLSTSTAQAANTAKYDEKHFTIGKVSIKEISDKVTLRKMAREATCDSADSSVPTQKKSLQNGTDGIDLQDIVNMGQTIWTIIQKNQPVVNIQIQKADAVPAGVSSWGDLECWQVPEARTFKVTYTNLYGMNVVDLALRVNYTYGGRINGQGRYLSQVTVLPAQVDVAWGFKLDAQVAVANVTNAGTRDNPVAGIQMDVNWVIRTPFKYSESTESFYVRGDGLFKQMR